MKFVFIIVMAIILIMVFVPLGQTEAGKTAPEISAAEWINTDGPLTLEALRGKIVVVEFWATWCPPCLKSIPHLNKLHQQYKDQDVVIIGLSDEDRQKANIDQFVSDMKIEYTIGTGSPTSRSYGVRGIPAAFIIDQQGQIVWNGHPMNMDQPLADAVESRVELATEDESKVTEEVVVAEEEPVTEPDVESAIEISAAEWINTEGPVSLEDFKGQVTVVEFWATWCPPCLASIPHLNELAEKYKDEGLTIIGLTNEDRQEAEIDEFVNKMEMNYIVGTGSASSRDYGVSGIPTAFIIDRQGNIAWSGHPLEMDEPLARILAGKE